MESVNISLSIVVVVALLYVIVGLLRSRRSVGEIQFRFSLLVVVVAAE